MNFSATSVCCISSRTTSRTSTLVSTARMFLADMLPDSFLHARHFLAGSQAFGEQRLVNIEGGASAGLAHDHFIIRLVPFQDRAGTDPELLPHFGGHGN